MTAIRFRVNETPRAVEDGDYRQYLTPLPPLRANTRHWPLFYLFDVWERKCGETGTIPRFLEAGKGDAGKGPERVSQALGSGSSYLWDLPVS